MTIQLPQAKHPPPVNRMREHYRPPSHVAEHCPLCKKQLNDNDVKIIDLSSIPAKLHKLADLHIVRRRHQQEGGVSGTPVNLENVDSCFSVTLEMPRYSNCTLDMDYLRFIGSSFILCMKSIVFSD